MQWFKVILAGLIEIVWVTGLNTADSLLSWTGTFIVIIISFFHINYWHHRVEINYRGG